jgi:TolB protein
VGNGCNTPSINPSVVKQGNSVVVTFSAWGPGITGIEVYLLGDAQDGPHPGGGGAWYLLASTGPEGGSVSIDTSWLFPKNRVVWVKAIYPGGFWSCYGRFRVTPGPTPTLPVPGFVPCPNCVQEIVYQSNKLGQWDIYKASPDGSNELKLTNAASNDTAPAWYPSGQYIAFQTDRDANWEIYTMDADGTNQINLSQNPAADVAPFWSCRYIYFQSNRDGNWEIYRMCPDGSSQIRLTDNAATDAQPAVSVEERVVFQSNRDGNWEIYTMNTDGTGVRRLTNTPWAEASPQFSPNGLWIAYQTNKTGQWEIAVMDLNGQNERFIVRTASPDESPAWHPYCDWIYFQSMRQGSWDIYRTT